MKYILRLCYDFSNLVLNCSHIRSGSDEKDDFLFEFRIIDGILDGCASRKKLFDWGFDNEKRPPSFINWKTSPNRIFFVRPVRSRRNRIADHLRNPIATNLLPDPNPVLKSARAEGSILDSP